jgi:hypothetical protein
MYETMLEFLSRMAEELEAEPAEYTEPTSYYIEVR